VITDSGNSLLIEAGIRYKLIQQALWSAGLSVVNLDGACLSHSHTDHCLAQTDMRTKGAVTCYASAATWEVLGVATVCHPRARLLEPDRVTIIANRWKVMPFELVHDVPTLGFHITEPSGETLVYVSDSAYCPTRFSNPVTIFAVEANFDPDAMRQNVERGTVAVERAVRTMGSHMSLDRTIAMLKANDLSECRAIYLLHLSDQNSSAEAFRQEVERATGVPAYVAGQKG
jgi:phosphoribosyl 1,2-cyclic phosphodiesterase